MKKFYLRILTIMVITWFSISSMTMAEDDVGISFSRHVTDGTITHESQKSLSQMMKVAQRNGMIEVWVAFDVYFNPDPQTREPDYEQRFNEDMQIVLSSTLNPLVEVGEAVLIPSPASLAGAPGRYTLVSKKGLKALSRSQAVIYIGAME